jgi:hypothetical protein
VNMNTHLRLVRRLMCDAVTLLSHLSLWGSCLIMHSGFTLMVETYMRKAENTTCQFRYNCLSVCM